MVTFRKPIGSISVSGHKFVGARVPGWRVEAGSRPLPLPPRRASAGVASVQCINLGSARAVLHASLRTCSLPRSGAPVPCGVVMTRLRHIRGISSEVRQQQAQLGLQQRWHRRQQLRQPVWTWRCCRLGYRAVLPQWLSPQSQALIWCHHTSGG